MYQLLEADSGARPAPWPVCSDLFSLETLSEINGFWTQALAGESTSINVLTTSGRHLEISAEPVTVDGVTMSLFGSLRIGPRSEEYDARKALETSERLFRTLADTVPAHVWILGSNYGPQYWNRRLLEYTGLTDEEVQGRGTMRAVHPDDLTDSLRVLRQAMRNKSEFELRQRIRGKDGEYRWFRVRGVCVLSPEGEVKQLVGISTDIQVELEMNEELERFKEILQVTSDLVFTTNPLGQLVYMNPTGRHLVGIQADEPIANHSIVPHHTRETVELIVNEGLKHAVEQGVWVGETCFIDQDGKEIPTSQVIVSHKDEHGAPTYFSTIARDITAQKRGAEELERARDAAMAATKAKSLFLATMSHEIKTPLNGIIGLTSLLASRLNDRGDRDLASAIQSSSESLLRIINDILDFSKAEAGKISIEPHACDLLDICRDVIGLYQAHAEQKGISLVLDAPEEHVQVLADALRLRQVLSNLVSNAIKFTNGGSVTLRLASFQEGDSIHAVFQVQDTGIGIDRDSISTVFDSFTQADPSIVRRFGGTGLGLAIVKSLTELMGGEVDCSSSYGKGSVFTVTMDLQIAEVSRSEKLSQGAERVHGHILLVEDNEVNQFVATQILEDLGCTVDVVDNGIAAISAALSHEYDLVLMDMHMPLCDGLEATRAIRAQETARRTPVVALTANADKESRESCTEAGMDGLLAKPFTLGQMHDVIRHYSVSLR